MSEINDVEVVLCGPIISIYKDNTKFKNDKYIHYYQL